MIIYPPDKSILYHRMAFRLNMDFDNILRMHEMHRDDHFSDEEKVLLTLQMLIRPGSRWRLFFLKWPQRIELMQAIIQNFINIKAKKSNDPRKSMDFAQDSPYIYASFRQAYGIDLHKEKLDWREFMALLQSMPEKTKIREIIRIRTEPLPEPTKHNSKQIARMIEAKAYWALEVSEAEAQQQFQQGIQRLASVLRENASKAPKKDGDSGG
ncbi:bacteriophage Gp15 family protein [Ruminococcaceae bacterium OttesenSCG-928-D13]|nr:bacteriophage Gp15 family protein [Ruminococcaceae bacterium OttesenSCG-928-D13]